MYKVAIITSFINTGTLSYSISIFKNSVFQIFKYAFVKKEKLLDVYLTAMEESMMRQYIQQQELLLNSTDNAENINTPVTIH